MTNRTSTDVIFGGAMCIRVIAKPEDPQSTAPADNQMNGDTPNSPRKKCTDLKLTDFPKFFTFNYIKYNMSVYLLIHLSIK